MTSEPPQGTQSDADPAATPPDHSEAAHPARGVKRTRAGGMWVAAAFFALILLLLLIFILQNTQQVSISYFGAHGRSALGVALLLAAVLGALLVAIAASWRIIQLRRAAHKNRRSTRGASA